MPFSDRTTAQLSFHHGPACRDPQSLFGTVGSVCLSTLPAYLRMRLGGDETMLTAVRPAKKVTT